MILKTFLGTLAYLFMFSAQANVIGHDVQNFNPLTSGLDFVSVHSSETLRPCVVNCGIFLNYAKNSLPNFPGKGDVNDSLISSDINIGIGLMRRWDLGLSISQVHSQSVDTDPQGIEYEETGLTDIRVNTKFRFLGDYNGGMAFVLSASFNQTENNPYNGIDAGPTINLELVADTQINEKVAVAANLGYRLRDPGEEIAVDDLCNTPGGCYNSGQTIEPFGDNWVASLAANYLVTDWNTKFIAEVYGSLPVDEAANTSTREQVTLEALLGAKKDFTDKFSGHIGGGFGLIDGSASPDFRIYSGINYALGPMNLGFCRSSDDPVIVKVEEGQDPAEAIMIAEDEAPPVQENIIEPELDEEVFVIRDVLFDTNKHEIKPEADQTIKDVAGKLQRPGGFKSVVVEGHTDSRMPEAYNQSLSERRAKSVMKRLISLGITEDKISAVGKGELEPIADNGNYQGRALNRRVEFRVRWR